MFFSNSSIEYETYKKNNLFIFLDCSKIYSDFQQIYRFRLFLCKYSKTVLLIFIIILFIFVETLISKKFLLKKSIGATIYVYILIILIINLLGLICFNNENDLKNYFITLINNNIEFFETKKPKMLEKFLYSSSFNEEIMKNMKNSNYISFNIIKLIFAPSKKIIMNFLLNQYTQELFFVKNIYQYIKTNPQIQNLLDQYVKDMNNIRISVKSNNTQKNKELLDFYEYIMTCNNSIYFKDIPNNKHKLPLELILFYYKLYNNIVEKKIDIIEIKHKLQNEVYIYLIQNMTIEIVGGLERKVKTELVNAELELFKVFFSNLNNIDKVYFPNTEYIKKYEILFNSLINIFY